MTDPSFSLGALETRRILGALAAREATKQYRAEIDQWVAGLRKRYPPIPADRSRPMLEANYGSQVWDVKDQYLEFKRGR